MREPGTVESNSMSFSELGLAEPLVRALEAKGYKTPTPIQRDSIPILLEGGDLLGIAQTGTGKTAAFVLPSIQRLVGSQKRILPTHCRMLVLAPTRELAGQIAESARDYGKFSKMSVATVFGGTSINKNRQDVSRGVDILVATPGRLIDLVEQGFLNLSTIEILVLDEADQMLDLGFIHALRKIVRMLPRKRQTLFFSATMPNAIRELADQFLHEPKTVSVKPAATTAERVDQYVTFVNQAEKTGAADDHPGRREYRPRAGIHAHQAWRGPRREAAERQRHPRQRDPRQQEPAPARACAGRVQVGRGENPGCD